MKTANVQIDPKAMYAAQNAREGLINVVDLSLLTGVPAPQLTGLAKKGILASHGEYHGKRFYNFEEVMNGVIAMDVQDEAHRLLRDMVNNLLQHPECPYGLEQVTDENGDRRVRVSWKDLPQAA